MKILTKEEEQAHYNETLKGGAIGGLAGIGLGTAAVTLAAARYPFFRGLTLPLRAFLITSAATFGGIVTADHYSHAYERKVNPIDQEFQARQRQEYEASIAGKTFTERALDFGRRERYKIVGGSWLASMVGAFALVNRNPYLSGAQKLVQARVYAQFLTLGVLVATAAFEISDQRSGQGRYETVKILDPNDPEHKRYIEERREVPQSDGDELWKDMIAAEEERIQAREREEARMRKANHKKGNGGAKKEKKHDEGHGNEKHDEKENEKEKDDHKNDEKPEKSDKSEKTGTGSGSGKK